MDNQSKDMLMKICLLFVAIGIAVIGCSKVNNMFNLENDNPIEEFLEEQLEKHTGLDIDLTPEDLEITD